MSLKLMDVSNRWFKYYTISYEATDIPDQEELMNAFISILPNEHELFEDIFHQLLLSPYYVKFSSYKNPWKTP